VLDRLERRRHLLEQRHQHVVDEHDAVLRVVGDVGELVGEQADVQRVQHRAVARRRHVDLEVALRVPRERGHAVARLDPERAQRVRDAVDPLPHLRVARALDALLA
jgi:hypothetical protein